MSGSKRMRRSSSRSSNNTAVIIVVVAAAAVSIPCETFHRMSSWMVVKAESKMVVRVRLETNLSLPLTYLNTYQRNTFMSPASIFLYLPTYLPTYLPHYRPYLLSYFASQSAC